MTLAFICIALIAAAVAYTLYLVNALMNTVDHLTSLLNALSNLVGEQAGRIVLLEKEVNKEIVISLSEPESKDVVKKKATKKKTTKKDAE